MKVHSYWFTLLYPPFNMFRFMLWVFLWDKPSFPRNTYIHTSDNKGSTILNHLLLFSFRSYFLFCPYLETKLIRYVVGRKFAGCDLKGLCFSNQKLNVEFEQKSTIDDLEWWPTLTRLKPAMPGKYVTHCRPYG